MQLTKVRITVRDHTCDGNWELHKERCCSITVDRVAHKCLEKNTAAYWSKPSACFQL